MAYPSFKRVLRETSLARKCRLLFLTSLLLLIAAAFWYVEIITENLIKTQTRKTGRDYVTSAIIKYHWVELNAIMEPTYKKLIEELSPDLQYDDYEWSVLALERKDIDLPSDKDIELPSGAEEEAILRRLKIEQRQQQTSKVFAEAKPDANVNELLVAAGGPVSRLLRLPEEGKILYYQPVYWVGNCLPCHHSESEHADGNDAEWIAKSTTLGEGPPPFRVVKVVIPDEETRRAINKNRAILVATAIVTVFLAMIALYVIVYYVIVKPLNHLRDVSDEVSHGNISLRSDIHTNDEIEELGAAFNRMLQHLVDAQQELRHVNTDLDAKVDELAQLNMKLYEMNRLKSDFLASMSHELRTPLNSIIGFSDVLQGIDALDERQRRYAQNIQKSGRVLLEMINDILDLAKMESGKMELRLTEFNVDAVISAQCDVVRSLAEEKNIDLEVDVQNGLPPLHQDQGKVQQVLMNLLSNAIKFTPEGGRIVVSGRRDGQGRFGLTVTDTGVGIAEEDRETIFEKFRQGSTVLGDDNLTREYSGTGLGLSIVKELCKLLGGELTFESELGNGSAFTVWLPWTCAVQPQPDESLAAKLNELTKPRQIEMTRNVSTTEPAVSPQPTTASPAVPGTEPDI